MTEPARPPWRHRLYFWVNERLMTRLLGAPEAYTLDRPWYVCEACMRQDHAHCESVNDRPSLCECCQGGSHGHPHDPDEVWGHPAATKPTPEERRHDLEWTDAWSSELDGIDVVPASGRLPERREEADLDPDEGL